MAKRKEIKEQIREILAEDFVGPPLPERQTASPFAADYVNAPPGYEPAPTEPLDWVDREIMLKGRAPHLQQKDYLVPISVRQEAHPASGYYGKYANPREAPVMGSRHFYPGFEQVPLRSFDEFYPPPTISNEEQEMIDAQRGKMDAAIQRALFKSYDEELDARRKAFYDGNPPPMTAEDWAHRDALLESSNQPKTLPRPKDRKRKK